MVPAITVLTPVYNGERYLAECIESVRAQTRTDWEYVIVDNCSTDRSAEIAEHYAGIDSRIRLVRCREFVNVYQSFSRAIEFMDPRSRYCKFVCADDWIYPECLERMVAVAKRHPSVGFVSAYRLYGDRVDAHGLLPFTEKEFVSGRDALRQALLHGTYPTGSPTTLLFAAEIVRRPTPFFDQATLLHADADAGLRTLLHADLGIVHEVLTFTRLHSDTHTHSFADRINTYLSLFVGTLIRYSSRVLTKEEYRLAIRVRLRQYWWFLFKASMKTSRRRDKTFQAFHNTEILRLLAEVSDEDRKTRFILKSMRALLADRSGTFSMP
jgi:glycosyltransferase involved in cell wall biosynthesis